MLLPAPDVLLPFLAIAAVAAYFQTVTGFGMGMIIIGASSSLSVIPVAGAVAIINFLTLSNSAIALPGKFGHINWHMAGAVLIAAPPAILAGVLLLDMMSTHATTVMRLLLGALICGGGISILFRSRRNSRTSRRSSFMASGALSGLFGGMFGIFGPPLIYQFYRQPLPLVSIRNMLIMLFSISASIRILLVGMRGDLDVRILILTGLSVPIVALATLCGRHFPPPLSPRIMRGVVFMVLVSLGGKLLGSAAIKLIA